VLDPEPTLVRSNVDLTVASGALELDLYVVRVIQITKPIS